MDEGLRELGQALPADTALVATGGYGQGLLAPHSDIDLLILSSRRLAAAEVRPVLMPLWDANLRVGHSVRTVKETTRLVGNDLAALSAHLTMRLLWGPADLVDQASRRLSKAVSPRRHRVVEALLAEERERRRAAPYGLLSPDLKSGRGGVRTLDLLTWLTRLGEDISPDTTVMGSLRTRLFELRSAFHLVAGRSQDVAAAELRVGAARLLGREPRDLVGDIVALGDAVEAVVDRVLPEMPAERRPTWSVPPVADDPVLAWAATLALAEDPRSLSPPALAKNPAWTVADRDTLLWLMTDARGRDGFWRLVRGGWLGHFLPEWEKARLQPHVVPFHAHAVGQHSLRTADELPTCAGWTELSENDRTTLRWAALLHDVGKGHGGDHPTEGARIVERLGTRLRWPRDLTITVGNLVAGHLALVEIATRRDLADPKVIAEGVRLFGDRRTLNLLRILTEADSKATGTDTWGPWKATLVAQASRRIEEAMGTPVRPPGALLEALVKLTGLQSNLIMEHVANVNDDYRSRVELAEMARDLELISAGGKGRLRCEVTREGGGVAAVAIVAPDRRGLVAGITGVATICDLNILAAQLFTRADGIACDRFIIEVTTDQDRDNLGRFTTALGNGDHAHPDLASRVAGKAHAYRHRVRPGIDPAVRVWGGGTSWEVQLRTADRRGLLHEVTTVLAGLGLDLRQVHVDTRAGVAYDTLRVEGRSDTTSLKGALDQVL